MANAVAKDVNNNVLILGCGFTGSRVARELVRRRVRVLCTTRSGQVPPGCLPVALDVNKAESLRDLALIMTPGMRVLHSVPLVESTAGLVDPTPILLDAIRESRPQRILYLSTTGVYGDAREVDERTPPAPRTPREILRIQAETAVASGDWSSLILRPAAIYGPGRGIQESVRAGTFRVPEGGGGTISRIHVDDLADHIVAGLFSSLTGEYPVADEYPCPSVEVAALAAELLHVSLPPAVPRSELPLTLQGNRRVDGHAIRGELGITLRYPTYREGVCQALSEMDNAFGCTARDSR